MPGMPGCSLLNQCIKDSSVLPSSYCSNSSLFADICMYDMPKMGSCLNATCDNCNPLPNLPTSKTATRAIFSICNEMNMDGCSNCKIASDTSTYANCDLLGTYGQLCRAMPEMSQCNSWNQMCSATDGIKFCNANIASNAPVMKMYFHSGINDYILFESAVPKTDGAYFLGWIIIFLFAFLYEGYQIVHFKIIDTIDGGIEASMQIRMKNAIIRGSTRFFGAGWTYLLMLISMTFNIGLFFAVIMGLGFGSAVFGPYLSKLQEKKLMAFQNEDLCC